MKNKVIILTDDNFNHRVLQSDIPVLVLFCSCWSGSSDIMIPIIAELALRFAGKVTVATLEADQYPELATKFCIETIPTLCFFKEGQVEGGVTGVISKRELTDRLIKLIRT